MRIPIVEYLTLTLSSISGLGYGVSGPPSAEVQIHDVLDVAPFNLGVTNVTVSDIPRCWASSGGVDAGYASLSALRHNAGTFCDGFSVQNPNIRVFGSGRNVFGWATVMFVGGFSDWNSCVNSFNTLLTACYGTANPIRPACLGGTFIAPGGANLAIAFGNGTMM